ncbi:MAG: energy transducer TonB [Moraxellaceae bacterium]|nr:energy transducer TonB [Moraxellaceae bacterium]
MVLVKSSGFSRLDRAAMQDVKRWKLIPARQGNEPVAAWYDAPVEYKME